MVVEIIKLLKSGNRLTINSVEPALVLALEEALSFTATKFRFGPDRHHKGAIELVAFDCFILDHRGRVSTSAGFYKRITDLLEARGYRVELDDLSPPEDPTIFEPQWDRILGPDARI